MENIYSIVSLSFVAMSSLAIILRIRRLRKKSRRPLPPGPWGYPVVGCLPAMIKNKPTFRWIHKIMEEMNTEIACIPLGSTNVIAVSSPELARELLKKQDAIFATRPAYSMSAWMTSGFLTTVLTPSGDQWKKMKKVLVSDVLSPATHQRLHDKRREEADHLVRYVYNQCRGVVAADGGGDVDLRVATRHYCGNVIRKLVFGKRFFGAGAADGGPGVEEREHVDGLFTILMYIYGFAVADYLPWMEVFDIDGHKKIINDAINDVRKYQDDEIAERVEMWKRGARTTSDDILDVLICLRGSDNTSLLSIQEIKAQITCDHDEDSQEIMLAAVDNPSNAVEWAIAEMINKPSILDRAREELDRVVGKNRLIQESDFPKLNYIKACIKEAFRLHPIAPFNVPHESTQDTVVGDYFIPKGSHVLLSRTGLGRNPRVWTDPLEFKPERHIPHKDFDVHLGDPELRMISFSTGRRGCIGVLLGTAMATQLLASLIQGFHWRASPKAGKVELVESETDLFMHKPLIAHATPRLEQNVYLQLFGNN
ncbi:phenylalanine N-monooxygenase-like protein [Perilla frutescens var. hirtella]|nr:phenylalanine N-monooxygenase-like protein [Perilla frutescens var. hirtella]